MVIAAFGSAEAALRTCASLPGDARVGLSCGDVLYENGALHGLPVIEASRLRDIATPGQILCAARLVRAGDLPAASFRSVGSIAIRGLVAALPVCEMLRTG
jgi:class 3 adenylate cyclase